MENQFKMNRKALGFLILLLVLTPAAYAITIDGPFNFQANQGGNVRFDPATVTNNIGILNTLYRYAGLTIGGNNRGALAFDCSTGTNMTILGVSRYEITYNVSAAGASIQYVYYANNDQAPIGTNTDNIAYNEATDIATVTTTGNVIVTLDYANLSGLGINGLEVFLNMLPIVALIVSLEAKKHDLISNRIVVMILVFAVAAFVVLAIRSAGY